MNKRKNNNCNGITLVALVLTVIIMTILAGISTNAILGENGIISNTQKAKINQQDSNAKEEIVLAWTARLTKFYEKIAKGEAKYNELEDYLKDGTELNKVLGSGGKINNLVYVQEEGLFMIDYTSQIGIEYIGKWKKTGEVVSFDRKENVVQTLIIEPEWESESNQHYSSEAINGNPVPKEP